MKLLSFDPGETTGYAVLEFEELVLLDYGELKLPFDGPHAAVGWSKLRELFEIWRPEFVVYELFSLRPWTARALSWNQLETVQVIGVIRYLSSANGVPAVGKPPSFKKQGNRILFSGLSPRGGHARDATRLGLAYSKVLIGGRS